MPEHLILRLHPATGHEAAWLAVDEHGQRRSEIVEGPPEQAARAADGRRVVVLVPGTEVLLARVHLPVRQADKLRRALPYSLEDQLAEDIEQLHFASRRANADGYVDAAVVARAQMDRWLARLAAAGLRAHAMYSDAQALPANPGSLTLIAEGERTYLVPSDGLPRVFEGIEPAQALELLDAESERPAPHVLAYGKPRHTQALQALQAELRVRGRDLDLYPLTKGASARMAVGILAHPGVDLLQGDYAARGGGYGAHWRPWRAAAALLAAAVLLAVGAQAAERVQLARAIDRLDTQIATTFRQAFGDRPVLDYRLQAQQELARLRTGGATDATLLRALDALGAALGPAHQAQLLAVSYRLGVIDLRLRVPNTETLVRVADALGARIQTNTTVTGGVEGRLQLVPGDA